MLLHWHVPADLLQFELVHGGHGQAGLDVVPACSQHAAPGIHALSVPKAASLGVVLSHLRRCYHVALVLDGTTPATRQKDYVDL